eukprot:scaffold53487_cov21-Tisochrysis_lutea.AAC.1
MKQSEAMLWSSAYSWTGAAHRDVPVMDSYCLAVTQVKWLGYKSPTFEPSSSFVTGVDTYCWDSKGAWEHFCQVGPQAFKPLFEEIAPAADSKKGGASKTPRTAPQP